jgi:uncharacterized protein (UPF0276 family)
MKLAINYSPQAAALLQAGLVEFDYFKCPDWPDMVAEASRFRTVRVHFELRAGSGRLVIKDISRIEKLLDQTGTQYVNLHIHPKPKDFPTIPLTDQGPGQALKICAALQADVETLMRAVGAERLILENVHYRGLAGNTLRTGVEPPVLAQLVRGNNCGLLLDISHARIAANALGIDPKTYIEQLPVEHLRELHFTGLQRRDSQLYDHHPIQSDDWPWLEWALLQVSSGAWARPDLLALEYGGVGSEFAWRSDPAVIEAQLPVLYRLVRAV